MNGHKAKERKQYIEKFLRQNEQLTHKEAAYLLTLGGYECVPRTIMQYRAKHKIDHINSRQIKEKVKRDIESGLVFNNADDLVERYGMSRQYANALLRQIKSGGEILITRRGAKSVEYVEKRVELPPVRVNTMAHAVHQLAQLCA